MCKHVCGCRGEKLESRVVVSHLNMGLLQELYTTTDPSLYPGRRNLIRSALKSGSLNEKRIQIRTPDMWSCNVSLTLPNNYLPLHTGF